MIAEKIKSYIDAKGIKQSAISRGTGINSTSLSLSFSGKRRLTAEEFVLICDFLEVPYGKFVE